MAFDRVIVTRDIRAAGGRLLVEEGAAGQIVSRDRGYVGVLFDPDSAYVELTACGQRLQLVPFVYTWPEEAAATTLSTVAFVHDGDWIENPFLSPDGKTIADPAEYGFQIVETGGGCCALDLALPDGGFIRLTDEDGSHLPDLADWQSALVGRYDCAGDELFLRSAREIFEAPTASSTAEA
jgi:hypothetical protein